MSEQAKKINAALHPLDGLWQEDRKAYDRLMAALNEGHRPKDLMLPTQKWNRDLYQAVVFNQFRQEMGPNDRPSKVVPTIKERLDEIVGAIEKNDPGRKNLPWRLEEQMLFDFAEITDESLRSTYNRAKRRYKANPDFAKFCDRLLNPQTGDEISKEILEGLRPFAK